ncbi:MAG TPA: D-2-hydroxyacid dehydrogenase [Thermoanaerobaculia bacterium]
MKILLMYEPGAEHLARLQGAAPKADFVVAHDEEEARSLVVDADAVLGNRWFYQTVDAATRLQWMQSNSMGVDLILERAGHRDFILTCARGVYDGEVAQHAVGLALALARGLPAFRDAQHHAEWSRARLRDIGDMDALILGWGGVGQGIARLLEPFGTRVQSGRSDGRHSFDVDLLFLALPLTSRTRHLVGTEELRTLRQGALVVNVGRGETLDTDALLAATHLGGAALDVFESEPLPADHPLWERRDILITPHVARSIEAPPFRWEPLFEENVRRFAAGDPLLHVVNREKGY